VVGYRQEKRRGGGRGGWGGYKEVGGMTRYAKMRMADAHGHYCVP